MIQILDGKLMDNKAVVRLVGEGSKEHKCAFLA